MSEDHTAEREAFEAWYSAEDQETDDPERTYELTEEGMNELTKYCVWQGWQARAAAPAQERIQALELEVRQLTEQIAELRGGGAAKEYAELPESCYEDDSGLKTYDSGDMRTFADATHALRIQQPAPAPQADSQPAPANTRQIAECYGDCPEDPKTCANPCKFEGRAACAPADSVLEDAARLERERICAAIKAEDDYCVEHGDYMLDSNDCINIVRAKWVRPDYLVDAARKQGANHD